MAETLSSLVVVFLDKLATVIREEVSMLLGVRSELEGLGGKVRLIKCLLVDAQNKAFHSEAVRLWLKELKDVIHDADDLVEDCKAAGEDNAQPFSGEQGPSSSSALPVRTALSVPFSFLHRVMFYHKVGQRLKGIKSRLEEISKERSQLQLIPDLEENNHRARSIGHQASSLVEPDITGLTIQLDAKKLIGVLVGDGSCRLDLVAITGMGGIGKTTLAQILYNDQFITANFQTKIWVCVSKDFSENKLLREIIAGAGGYAGEAHTRARLEPILRGLTQGKKVFLVLDDVWAADVWEDLLRNPLQGAATGSKVLITTRFEAVAKRVGAVHLHPVAQMTPVEGWFLLCKKVFVHGEEFAEMESLKDVGLRVVERCCRLPLAIKVVGGALRGRGKNREEWEEVLRRRTSCSTIFPEDMKNDKVMEALHLSYEDLPPHLKQCFLYLSLFPEDHVFISPSVVRQWIAEGFVKSSEGDASALEQTGQEYFRELVGRSLLQPELGALEGAQCRMHDLLRSLAQFLAEDENFFGPTSKLGGVSPKLRRLSIEDGGADVDLEALKSKECLRTLFLFKNPHGGLVLRNDFVETLGNLRVLDLREARIEELPHCVAKLRHLRLLDVSGTAIREVPESIAGLRSLQFLLLNNCSNISALPTGITKLKNLRALELYNGPDVDQMPKGMGGMTQLRNLKDFAVGSVERTLEELGPLVNLRLLAISKLERVSDKEGARKAALENKPLVYLGLRSSTLPAVPSCDEQVKSRMVDVFDGLRPPPSLQYLDIVDYVGTTLPAWMWPSAASAGASPIQNLACVILNRCMNFSQLPPLGLLPHLKSLWITGAHAVTSAISSTNYQDVTTACAGATVLFPELDLLCFIDMPNLQEIWTWGGDGGGESPRAFPRLRHLYFEDCPKLRRIPNCFPSRLKFLHIMECPGLMEVGDLILAECLTVSDSKTEDLPPWLGQVSVDPSGGDGFPFLLLKLRFCLLKRVLRQREEDPENSEGDWYTVKRFPSGHVTATDEESAFLSYRNPSFFNTNVQINAPCSSDGKVRDYKRQRVE